MSEELDRVVEELGHSYSSWKKWGKDKEANRKAFFGLADEEVKKQGLALRLETCEAESMDAAEARVLLHNPGWKTDTKRPHRVEKDTYEFVLIEDPSLKAFSYEHNGVKYARQVSKGSVMLDDEWLKEDDPELYELVTFALPWGERIAVPVEHLQEPLLRKLTKYIYTGDPKVVLAPPREVKE